MISTDSAETLVEQVERRLLETKVPRFAATRPALTETPAAPSERERVFNNGLGGFTPDGREYVIIAHNPARPRPRRGSNVHGQRARIGDGDHANLRGGAYTWVDNAHEFRLTPWNNDPVCDASGEAFYIRDEETGQFWSPTPLPARGPERTC